MKYDFLIVGAGFFGATFARKATDAGKSCLVVDKSSHTAGAAYDRKWDNGVIVGQYGAHIFHTQSEEVWAFMNKFATMDPFINKPKVLSNNKIYSFPINLMTLHQLWGVVTPQEAFDELQKRRIPCEKPRNFEEWILDRVGKELYELFFYGYTKKQWMKEPSELPASIIQRLPIRLTYEENYFTTKYQAMPREGHGKTVDNMLDGIKVELGQDFFEIDDWRKVAKHLVYTGPVDKFYNYCHGELEYNTLRFEHRELKGDFQGNAVINHVDMNTPYIRTIEHKHFFDHRLEKHYNSKEVEQTPTVVSYDIPVKFKDHPEPYYPIRDEQNSSIYNKYLDLKQNQKDVTFGGRLGEYKYLDIDQTIASAIKKAKNILD
jgi:UDP-galactopyranose mutase